MYSPALLVELEEVLHTRMILGGFLRCGCICLLKIKADVSVS